MTQHTWKVTLVLLLTVLAPGLMGDACVPPPVIHEVVTDDYTIEYWEVGSERVGRSLFRYSFTVTLRPTLSGASNARALASSASLSTMVDEGNLSFGNVAMGATATATTQLQILQDRNVVFDSSAITWEVILPEPTTYDFSAFEAEIEAWIAETEGIEGVGAILVDLDDGVVYKRSFRAFTDDRVYLVASSSKMVTAGVLLALQDQGLLDMDAPVNDVVDWGDEHNPDITPAQLVSNTSGLVGLFPFFGAYICQYIYTGFTLSGCGETIFTTLMDDEGDPSNEGQPAHAIPPDTMFRYGGGQWQVAGAVAEIASGKSWAELIQETYVAPCGLETFGYNNHFSQLSGESFSYPIGFDGDLSTLEPTDNPNMEGGLYTTIGDYAKLLLMHLRGGMCGENRVLSEESVQTLHTDRLLEVVGGSTGAPGMEGYGYGWWFDRGADPVLIDPGAYGSTAWLDEERGYAGFLVIEETSLLGAQLFAQVHPLANAAFDEARPPL
jgi:CubicO group peptidase (beta-lactamase class C family)